MNPSFFGLTRRRFLKHGIATAVAFNFLPVRVVRGQESPAGKITLAGVGVGGVGFGQLQECEKAGFQILALCDVDHGYAGKAFERWPQARRYRDFREMLAEEGDRIDAVYCGTPDHTHALVTVAALRKRKHVCCVKPLTRTIHELDVVLAAARQAGTATQVTAAPNTGEAACRTCEIVQAGVLGEIRELLVWSNRPVWPQGMDRPTGEDPVPAHLDWQLWLGPAPRRPFKSNWPKGHPALTQMNLKDWDPGVQGVYHPFNFRGWWDFGTGALGDMGCHHFNTPFRALKLGSPDRIEASCTRVFAESAPLASTVTLDFPARSGLVPVRAVWYDGGLRPAPPKGFDDRKWPSEATLYVGDKGWLLSSWDGIAVGPEPVARASEGVAKTLQRRPGTWKEWFDACKGGQRAGCDFEWAGPLTETVLLGNVALRSGKRLAWDSVGRKSANFDVQALLSEPYHNGWSLDSMG